MIMSLKNVDEKITEFNKLDYYNNLKTTTIKQKESIELKQIQKCKIKRKQIISKLKKQPKTIWLNTLKKRIPVSELTEEIMESEEELWEYLFNNDHR